MFNVKPYWVPMAENSSGDSERYLRSKNGFLEVALRGMQ